MILSLLSKKWIFLSIGNSGNHDEEFKASPAQISKGTSFLPVKV